MYLTQIYGKRKCFNALVSLRQKLALIYHIIPFLFSPSPIKNRFSFIFSILTSRPNYNVKFKNDMILQFKSSQFEVVFSIIYIIKLSTSYSINSKGVIEFSFDHQNKFSIPISNLSHEDENLLELFCKGSIHGANFITENKMGDLDIRDKTIKIIQKDGKKIVETSTGIKFYLDSIHPEVTIVETFVSNIHMINSHYKWSNKVVVDAGAECGDTPLYYANMGAKIFAFEPIKAHFDAMMRNISLNPELSERIIPINAAIGKDGPLKFYQSNQGDLAGGASFVYNVHRENVKISDVTGYSLESAFKEFNINHVDLLKMDCKGCEFLLTENALKNVDMVKIEFLSFDNSHKLKDLLKILENAGFKYMIYKINPRQMVSNNVFGHIYGKKIQSNI